MLLIISSLVFLKVSKQHKNRLSFVLIVTNEKIKYICVFEKKVLILQPVTKK